MEKRIAKEIKAHLVRLALSDELPLDLSSLNTEPIENIITNALPKRDINLRLKAASFILSGSNIEAQLKMLDNAEKTIPDEVLVWEKFEYEPLENILSYIDDLECMLKDVYNQR